MGFKLDAKAVRELKRLERLTGIRSGLLVTVEDAHIEFELMNGNLAPARIQARIRDARIRDLLKP